MSAIYILWLRQLKRYFRTRIRILSALGQPLLFLVSLGFGFGPLYQRAGAGNYLQYLVPGVILLPSSFVVVPTSRGYVAASPQCSSHLARARQSVATAASSPESYQTTIQLLGQHVNV